MNYFEQYIQLLTAWTRCAFVLKQLPHSLSTCCWDKHTMWQWADARRGAVRVILLTISWTFTVLGDPNGYIYVPVPAPTQPPSQYELCISNEQCGPNECCKPSSVGYFACSPIGYDPRQCIQYSSPLNFKCNKDADCQYGGCCVTEAYGWGTCRYDAISCKKDDGPKKCSSSRECGLNGCCAWDPYLGNNYCLGGTVRASKRAIIFPQTKYPPYQPPAPTKYPPYITPPSPTKYPPPPYPTPPTKYPLPPVPYPYPTKYPPLPPYPNPTNYPPPPPPYPNPTKYPVYPPYPPPPTKYPVYPPYPPPPTKYPTYPTYPPPPTKYPVYPPYPPPPTKYPSYPPYPYPPPPSPTKYPTYPPYPYPPPPSPTKYPTYPPLPSPTKYPPYQTAWPLFCIP